ncbi:MAG: DUF917 domain-containing protein [Slackia sp.]|nr:DUF917 domain-containing protein [Slackia sp.]
MRKLGVQAVEDIARGAAVMASGGGGDPYLGMVVARQTVEEFGPITLLELDEIPDEARVVVSMGLGAPTVLVEKVPRGTEPEFALQALESACGCAFDALLPSEAGGWNSLHPMLPAARRGLPLLDADGMGRAFPELQMVTWSVFGQKSSPIGVADERGNVMVVETDDNKRAEDLCRGATVMMGGNISLACYGMTGAQAKANSVAGTYTLCEEVGAILRSARANRVDAYDRLMERLGAVELFRGKVQDVERRTTGGFARGIATLEGMDAYRGGIFEMEFQNEFLMARRDGVPVCTAPDLIAAFDVETLTPITGEALKYGCRALVLGIPCAPQWRTPEGLAVVGPAAFGYEGVPYVPVEQRAY